MPFPTSLDTKVDGVTVIHGSDVNALQDIAIGPIFYKVRGSVYNAPISGADAAVAINAAIVACNAAGGGTVFLPGGAYTINSTLNMLDGVYLEGVGTSLSAAAWTTYSSVLNSAATVDTPLTSRLIWNGAANGTMISFSKVRHAGLRHLCLYGATGGIFAGVGIDIISSISCRFDDVLIEIIPGTPGIGVRLTVFADAANNNCMFNSFQDLAIWNCQNPLWMGGGVTGLSRVTLNTFNETFLLTSLATSQNITLFQYVDTNWFFATTLFSTANSATAFGIIVNGTATPTVFAGADGNMFYGLTYNTSAFTNNNIGIQINASQLNSFTSNFWIVKSGNEFSVPTPSNTSYTWLYHNQSANITTRFPGPIEAVGVSGLSSAAFGWRYAGVQDLIFQRETATAYVLRAQTPNTKALTVNQATGAVQIGDAVAGVATTIVAQGSNPAVIIQDTGGNGANLKLLGNGGTTASKTMRAFSGAIQWLNDAYSVVIQAMSDTGAFTTYNSIATQGLGVLPIYRAPAPTINTGAAVASIATITSPNDAVKHVYLITGTVTITVLGSASINLQAVYTDEQGTARTQIIPLASIAGVYSAAAAAADAFKGMVVICVNPNTAITLKTAGTFTGVTYDCSGQIMQVL